MYVIWLSCAVGLEDGDRY